LFMEEKMEVGRRKMEGGMMDARKDLPPATCHLR
jgi:hypothetical protein